MIEQEIASIIKVVLDSAGNPQPYYHDIPQDFIVPAVYFPQPEVTTGGDTLCTYRLDFTWHIVFRAATQADAFEMAYQALVEIKMRNDKIPLIDDTGQETEESIRLGESTAKAIDQCRAQLSIGWTSRRMYSRAAYLDSLERVQDFIRESFSDPDLYLTRTIDTTIYADEESFGVGHSPAGTKKTTQ